MWVGELEDMLGKPQVGIRSVLRVRHDRRRPTVLEEGEERF